MSGNQDGLIGKRQIADAEMSVRVRRAVDDLVRAGITPSFYSVAELAGVARSTLYRKPALRQMVDGAKQVIVDGQPSWRTAIKQLKVENESLRRRVSLLTCALRAARSSVPGSNYSSQSSCFKYAICEVKMEDEAA